MKASLTLICSLVLLYLAVASVTIAADVPQLINVQGKLTDAVGDPVADGSYSVVFSIYDVSTGGSVLWQETQSVDITDGLFSVELGSVTTLSPSLFDDTALWLGIKVGADPEMTPRQRLTTAPYAFRTSGTGVNTGWVDDGTVVRLEANTDSVGIGTASPSSRLHVLDSNGTAVRAISQSGVGAAAGLYAESETWHAVLGINDNPNAAVMGRNDGTGPGVKGQNQSSGPAITGYASTGNLLELYTTPGPNLKLTVNNDGDLQASGTIESTSGGFKFPDGTVQTTAAGSSPIAFAVIDSSGNILSSWPSGLTCTWNAIRYEITIPGETYHYSSYVSVVTPIGSTVKTATTTSGSGKLAVYFFDSAGAYLKTKFQFVTYKP